jgi:hypothetical protein
VDETWFVDTKESVGLVRFDLLGLSSGGLARVIDRWYAAALKRETDPRQQAWLGECSTSLWTSLSVRPNLRSLVSSPLLAGLICALYRQNNQYLPRTRRELLDQALDLLLERWDSTKASETKPDEAVKDELNMNKAQKRVLLERIAATMVRGAEPSVAKSDGINRLRRAMEGLRPQEEKPASVLQYLLVRTGLIREVRNDQTLEIEFVHRTFRDYLAANEMVKAGDLGMLVTHAHEDSWYEVVFMAAAQAREREVADLLTRLLKRAGKRDTDDDVANRLKLVAAACLGYADVVDPDDARVEVQNATQGLIPPATVVAAELLAKAGRFVVDLLPEPSELAERPDREEAAARVIRTLALVDFRDRVYEERRWDMLPRLKHLVNLRYLKLSVQHSDFARGLYSLPDDLPLTELAITNRAERRSLLGVDRWPSLTAVAVHGVPTTAEVEEIGRLPHLRRLDLYGVPEEEAGAVVVEALPDVTVHVHTARML